MDRHLSKERERVIRAGHETYRRVGVSLTDLAQDAFEASRAQAHESTGMIRLTRAAVSARLR